MRSIALLCACALAGCAHPQRVPRENAVAATGTGAPGHLPHPMASSCITDDGCARGQRCVNNTCVAADEPLGCNEVRVHFAFDSSEIPTEARDALERAARCLQSSRATKIAIEGNTDERGTEEYNVALGDRRARMVAGYLVSLGASADQLKTVSYGKENPLCTTHDAACRAANRRADLELARR